MLGAIEVDQFGDLANWTINKDHPKHPEIQVPELKGMGGGKNKFITYFDFLKLWILFRHMIKLKSLS